MFGSGVITALCNDVVDFADSLHVVLFGDTQCIMVQLLFDLQVDSFVVVFALQETTLCLWQLFPVDVPFRLIEQNLLYKLRIIPLSYFQGTLPLLLELLHVDSLFRASRLHLKILCLLKTL